MKILFVNGSPNKKGNTAQLAAALLEGKEYETLNLVDYRINVYGQKLPGDQLDEVLAKIKGADVLAALLAQYLRQRPHAARPFLRSGRIRQPEGQAVLPVSGSSTGKMDA